MVRVKEKVRLTSYEDLFQTDEARCGDIQDILLEELHEFQDHPFKIIDDEKMEELVESIRQNGVLVPGICRKCKDGGYEIIAGHRRRRASFLAGKKTMPMLVREYSDDEAVQNMVDSNIQRENILPSEKAKAYSMKYTALKHQGVADGMSSLEQMGQLTGENGKTIQRFIKLASLCDEFLDMLDQRKITQGQGLDLAYLSKEEQKMVIEVMQEMDIKLSAAMTRRLKKDSMENGISMINVKDILGGPQKERRDSHFRIDRKKLRTYFPNHISDEQMETIIFGLLDNWKKNA